jgi:hypothetical protein
MAKAENPPLSGLLIPTIIGQVMNRSDACTPVGTSCCNRAFLDD